MLNREEKIQFSLFPYFWFFFGWVKLQKNDHLLLQHILYIYSRGIDKKKNVSVVPRTLFSLFIRRSLCVCETPKGNTKKKADTAQNPRKNHHHHNHNHNHNITILFFFTGCKKQELIAKYKNKRLYNNRLCSYYIAVQRTHIYNQQIISRDNNFSYFFSFFSLAFSLGSLK